MTQAQLNRAVARVTGESLATIQRRGFSPVMPQPLCHRVHRPRAVSASFPQNRTPETVIAK
jgi:hypothetical protein